jgi:uncharacterized Zn finger protein (UPF0148 family)
MPAEVHAYETDAPTCPECGGIAISDAAGLLCANCGWLEDLRAERDAARAELQALKQRDTAPARRKLPPERASKVRKMQLPPVPRDPCVCEKCGHVEQRSSEPLRLYAIPGFYEDGALGEIFIRADRVGSFSSGILDGLAIVISLALQHGVPKEAIARQFIAMQFSPAGLTGDPEFPMVQSVLDYIGRWLLKVEAPR